jgi:hypothetical protein
LPEEYDRLADVQVLAKVALLRTLYSEYPAAEFKALLTTLVITITPSSTTGRQGAIDQAYCAALEAAYLRHKCGTAHVPSIIPSSAFSAAITSTTGGIPAPTSSTSFSTAISAAVMAP